MSTNLSLNKIRLLAALTGSIAALLFEGGLIMLGGFPETPTPAQIAAGIVISGVCSVFCINAKEELNYSNDGGAMRVTAFAWATGLGGLLLNLYSFITNGEKGRLLNVLLEGALTGHLTALIVGMLISVVSIPFYLVPYVLKRVFKFKIAPIKILEEELLEKLVQVLLTIACVMILWTCWITGRHPSDWIP